eukprot:scaffold6117_cov118-Isochrysis_galbana.AAC.2
MTPPLPFSQVGDLGRRARDAQSLGNPHVNGGAAGASSKELYGFDWSPSFKASAQTWTQTTNTEDWKAERPNMDTNNKHRRFESRSRSRPPGARVCPYTARMRSQRSRRVELRGESRALAKPDFGLPRCDNKKPPAQPKKQRPHEAVA